MSHLFQFDDFAPDAEEVREAVIRSTFSTQTGPDGAQYTGISLHAVPQWEKLIEQRIGKKIKASISCFRLNLEGELPNTWVHSDGVCSEFASILYLNTPEQCMGGTAFWRHKILGINKLPTRTELDEQGTDSDAFYKQIEKDWQELDLWDQTNVVAMKWNRFITYPSCYFHSRYPFESFGHGPEDGRLIWICFYDEVS